MKRQPSPVEFRGGGPCDGRDVRHLTPETRTLLEPTRPGYYAVYQRRRPYQTPEGTVVTLFLFLGWTARGTRPIRSCTGK